jgi:hypothetical protein
MRHKLATAAYEMSGIAIVVVLFVAYWVILP